jgi:hypothetical protein
MEPGPGGIGSGGRTHTRRGCWRRRLLRRGRRVQVRRGVRSGGHRRGRWGTGKSESKKQKATKTRVLIESLLCVLCLLLVTKSNLDRVLVWLSRLPCLTFHLSIPPCARLESAPARADRAKKKPWRKCDHTRQNASPKVLPPTVVGQTFLPSSAGGSVGERIRRKQVPKPSPTEEPPMDSLV